MTNQQNYQSVLSKSMWGFFYHIYVCVLICEQGPACIGVKENAIKFSMVGNYKIQLIFYLTPHTTSLTLVTLLRNVRINLPH